MFYHRCFYSSLVVPPHCGSVTSLTTVERIGGLYVSSDTRRVQTVSDSDDEL